MACGEEESLQELQKFDSSIHHQMLHNLFLLVAVSTAALLPTAIAQVPEDCSRTYEVVADDTCDGISASQGVSTFQLAHVNAGIINQDCTNLFIGQTLCLGITGQDCEDTHKVVSGDTCWDISVAAEIDLSTLLTNNPNVDSTCSNIYPDEVLCTASDVIEYD